MFNFGHDLLRKQSKIMDRFSLLKILFLFLFFAKISSKELIVVTLESLFAVPHEGDTVRFQCSQLNESVTWILPDETQLSVLPENSNNTQMSKFVATKNFLEITYVENGMDGQYICVLADSSRRFFFIPHVISEARLTKSILISLSVTGVFCIVCVIILLVDRYCFPDIDVVKAQIVQKSIRKKNISNSTIAKLEII
uniref:Immunoglobulin subtype 2 domain-containing protein n=1 Tax=Panagrolaimus sp. JU765 TaxID=591449 RepID=A0AC34RPF3_9BILA